jgi:xylulokinase
VSDYLLGLDYGTGGAKACLINADGDALGTAFEEYPLIHEKPSWSEHDPVLYWEIACRMIKGILAESRVDPRDIRGIGVSSALPSMVMIDEDLQPIHRAYNLMDRRATAEVEWLKDQVGERRMMELTANRLEDHPALVNLLWEKNNRPDSFDRIHKALTIAGFINLKLTGQLVVNYCDAAFYGVAYDILNRTFDEGLMDEIGISPEILPRLVDCEDMAGRLTPEAAEETGLAPGIPVATQVDFNASCIAAGITAEGDIMSNLGTVGNFGVIFRDREFMFSSAGLSMINLAFTIDSESTYITIPSTTTGGQSIRYLRDNFSAMEVQVERALGVSSYDLLNLQAADVPVGSEGLIVLPYLMGERTPIWDQYAKGVIFGLSLHHTKGHVVRAMMEAVAYALYDSFRLIREAGLKINYPIVFHEGGTASTLWRQIITDVFNVPTVLVKQRAGAPLGDAILAGVVTGAFSDYSVAKEWASYTEPAEPNQENHERYMAYFDLYKQLYHHVKDDFKALAELRDRPEQ